MHAVHDVFPVSEQLLCYFVAALAEQGLAPATIAAVRHAQVVRGLPEPRASPSPGSRHPCPVYAFCRAACTASGYMYTGGIATVETTPPDHSPHPKADSVCLVSAGGG